MSDFLSKLRRALNKKGKSRHKPGPAAHYFRPSLESLLESRIVPVAQPFTDLGALGLSGVAYSSVAWGDYDSDGDLDVVLAGKESGLVAKIFRNTNGTFTDISAGLTPVYRSAVAWGDYDADGDLDILLTGDAGSSNRIAKVYRNDSGTFTDINAGLTGVRSTGGSTSAWGDYDNDGDLDILLTGEAGGSVNTSKVYRNDSGTFTDISAGLTPVGNGSVAWGDYDNDGDLDILLTGRENSVNRIAKVYRNDGNSGFTDITAGLTGVNLSSVAWGDYDNDGDLDILLTGNSAGGRVAKVYRNTGGTFSDIGAGLTAVDFASVAWGDYDNDGDLDILLNGRDGSNAKVSKVYQNTGGTFTDIIANLTGIYDGSVAWGDYDGDGDLDILATGDAGSLIRITKVYRNNTLTANTAPGAPTNLQATAPTSTSITFSWNAATDGQTPSAGLSYNLRVGTTPGGSDVFSTMSDTDANAGNGPNGYRRVAQRGPIQGTSYTLKGLTPGTTYYWSVQAIDTAFAGSLFATQQSFTTPQFTDLGSLGLIGGIGGTIAWGDFDNDGDLDALSTGNNGSNFARVFRNDGGTFVDISAGLVPVVVSSAAWGDYDNDGDLDILLTGRNSSNAPIAAIYRNDGNGNFTDIAAGLTGVRYSAVAWGDYDNDGDLDILLTGRSGSSNATNITRIYRNDGNNTFTDISASLPGVSFGSVAWGDYDNDGDLDILIAGTSTSGVRITGVYRNDGNGSFTDIAAGLLQLNNSSLAWGDYDNDGNLDILLTGQNSGGVPHSLVYHNTGSGGFQNISAGLTGVFYGAVAWGDYDNDGDLDILLTGRTQASARIARIYRNDSGTFTDISTNVTGMDLSSVAWGDYDNDGDLDILLSGRDGGNNFIARVFRNNSTTANTAPNAPTNLGSTVSGTSVTFSWTAPTDGQTPSAGLSYNLRVGTTPGGSDVFSTMANTSTGLRRIADTGPIQGTSYTLKGLATGTTYYWSVQAIDTAFAGSLFSTESSFSINAPPVLGGAVANQAVNDNATINPFSTFTISDADVPAQTLTVEVQLSNATNGVFTATSLTASGFTDQTGGLYRFTGTAAQAQTAIRQLVFDPTDNQVAPGLTVTTTFTVSASDGIAPTVSNNTTSVVATAASVAPKVVSFQVLYGNGMSYELIGATPRILPWQVTGIRVKFSEAVNGTSASLSGVSVGSFSGSGTDTLTWTFTSALLNASLTAVLQASGMNAIRSVGAGLALDGNGDTTPGDNFSQQVRVLYGDVNGDGFVNSTDASLVRARMMGQSVAVPDFFLDVNGDGVVDSSDFNIVRSRSGQRLI